MPRAEVDKYYPIIRFLEVECLHTPLHDNILNEIEHYDLFVIMKLAHNFSDQKIFEKCFEALEK